MPRGSLSSVPSTVRQRQNGMLTQELRFPPSEVQTAPRGVSEMALRAQEHYYARDGVHHDIVAEQGNSEVWPSVANRIRSRPILSNRRKHSAQRN
jgi:hypothetical protein